MSLIKAKGSMHDIEEHYFRVFVFFVLCGPRLIKRRDNFFGSGLAGLQKTLFLTGPRSFAECASPLLSGWIPDEIVSHALGSPGVSIP
jgi:hypothetical protein